MVFGGLEEYGLIVLRNMAVKCVGIVLLFLFIRTKMIFSYMWL